MRFGQQEDAHEFLRYTINAMQESCLSGCTGYVGRLSDGLSLLFSAVLLLVLCLAGGDCGVSVFPRQHLCSWALAPGSCIAPAVPSSELQPGVCAEDTVVAAGRPRCRDGVRPGAAVSRLDCETQATTLVHQIFGGYLRSRGECSVPGPGPAITRGCCFAWSLVVKMLWENH